jgi:Transcriptional regulator, AbiEi antitoxin
VGDQQLQVQHGALAELATRQHGVVATRQLARLGYSRSSVAKAAKVGRLHRLHRGVYAVGHQELSWHGRCMAAVLASAPSVASHLSAAWLWGLLRSRPGTLHVTSRSPRHGDRLFKVHRADELKVFDLGEMQELLDRARGHRGRAKVRAALDAYRPERKFTRSGFERRFLEVVREAGLPEPAMNVFVAGHELDAYWEEAHFGVELDAYETHGSRLSFEDDRVRDDDFLHAELVVTRVTETRLDREPRAVVDSLRRHRARRGVD